MEHWTDFGVGQLPSFSARKRVEFPPPIEALAGAGQRPLQGLTSDGTLRPGLFPLRPTGVSTVGPELRSGPRHHAAEPLLAEVTGLPDDFGEWPYFLSFYGEPSAERPWAWQIDGDHLCLNGTVIGDPFLLTPQFHGLRAVSGVRRSAGRHDGLHR